MSAATRIQEQLFYGGVPVPFTVSWSGEAGSMRVDTCAFAQGRRALCQAEARGEGKPLFGKPHCQRQRQAIVFDLCDLCGRGLKNRTKVSLSHAKPRTNGAEGIAVLQVEPLLHRECAATSLKHCPSLKRDVRAGVVRIRQVTRHRVQFAIMDDRYVKSVAGVAVKAIGHAKVELQRWIDRDMDWLLGITGGADV